METVAVSPKYQVVIPSRVRRLFGVEPGQKVKVILYDNRIEVIPAITNTTSSDRLLKQGRVADAGNQKSGHPWRRSDGRHFRHKIL